MPRIAYFDCFSGCSGDMVLGALLDAGLDRKSLISGLSSLDLKGYQISVDKVKRSALAATKFNVEIDRSVRQPEHSLAGIRRMIDSSRLSDKVKKDSIRVFERLGEVEARIHGVSVEKIHFHEVGAVDSIIDIVGSVLAFDILGIERFYSSPLPLGRGTVLTSHGTLPVPAPATLQLLAMAKAPTLELQDADAPQGEIITPTGAALITAFSVFSRPEMILERVGYGAGSKDFDHWPNVLRIWLGTESEGHEIKHVRPHRHT